MAPNHTLQRARRERLHFRLTLTRQGGCNRCAGSLSLGRSGLSSPL